MSRQHWVEALTWMSSNATAVANTTSETILITDETIPANFMQDARVIRIEASGQYSTTGTPTMTFGFRWGGVGGTQVSFTAAATGASGVTNALWRLKAEGSVRTNGATGTILLNGFAVLHGSGGAVTTTQALCGTAGTSPATATVDLTTDQALSFTGKWSAASSSNTITCMQFTFEALN